VDVSSTAAGLRTALLENPDVIFVNEIEDRATIDLMLQAADRGILVIGIVGAHSSIEAIERMRCHFSDGEQSGFNARLARCLNAIYFQRMVPDKTEGRVPCVEVCKGAPEVMCCIRDGDLKPLRGLIERGVDRGMHTHDQYLVELFAAGIITRKTALEYGISPSFVERALDRPTISAIMKYAVRIVAPLGFLACLNTSINASTTVNLDRWSPFVFLALCLPFTFMTTRAYVAWFLEIDWPKVAMDADREHWLARVCASLEQRNRQFARRWLCWLATHWVSYSEWPLLYRQGLAASPANSSLALYFAQRLFYFDNALDALNALDVLRRHDAEPGIHPNIQVQVFIARANGEAEIPGLDPQPVTSGTRTMELRRNPIIRLFEGADPIGSAVWNPTPPQSESQLGSPTEPRASTAVLFASPVAPQIPFQPVRLQIQSQQA